MAMRRWHGRALDLWLARTETPSRLVLERSGVKLRDYGDEGNRPSLLIIPAPIKKSYIWDRRPQPAQCWRASRHDSASTSWSGRKRRRTILTMDLRSISTSSSWNAQRLLASSPSWRATLWAARSRQFSPPLHTERVRALILLEAPLSFAGDAGAIAELIRIGPATEALRKVSAYPGTVLNALSLAASPESFLWWRWRDRLLSAGDPAALRTHLLVERWTLDEYAMPSALFADVVALYREDLFMRGTLRIEGQTAAPSNVTMPVLAELIPTATSSHRARSFPFSTHYPTGIGPYCITRATPVLR